MKIIEFIRMAPLLGEYFYEVYWVYEMSAFIWSLGFMVRFRDLLSALLRFLMFIWRSSVIKVMGFMRRVPLGDLWGLSGEHLYGLYGLFRVYGLYDMGLM